jgi:hypothetical protein
MDYEKWEIFNLEKKLKFLCDDAERERERENEKQMCPALEQKQIDRTLARRRRRRILLHWVRVGRGFVCWRLHAKGWGNTSHKIDVWSG